LGPAHSVRSALAFIAGGPLDAAILDVSPGRENYCPVADALMKLGIPIAFATGYAGETIDPGSKMPWFCPNPSASRR